MLLKMTRCSTFLVLFSGLGQQAQAKINLGTASSFGVVASSEITNTGPTVIQGQIGISPADASSVTGFPPGTAIASSDVSSRAKQDAQVAYNAARSLAPTRDITGQDLGGQLLVPGTYFASSSVGLTGTLTLDGRGDPNAQFVFQIASTLTTATSSAVVFINGARACNVFWQIGSSATLGTGTTFTGNIIAQASITLTTGTTVNGGLYALTGAVTLDTNRITAPQGCPQQPTGKTSSAAITTSPLSSSMSVSGPVSATPADTTTTLPSKQGAPSGGLSGSISSNGGASNPESSTSTTELGNTIIISLPGNSIRTDSSESLTATTLSRDQTTATISKRTQATASMETDFSSMRSNMYATTMNTRSVGSTSLEIETSEAQPTSYKTLSANSTYWKFRATTAPSNFAGTVPTKGKSVTPTTTAQYGITTASNDKITTINGTPCTTISYYEPTCSCTTTTVVPLAYTPAPSPKVSVTTVNGVPCTTTRFYESACDCIRTSNVPLQVITASASVATVVNGVPCVTSKYYESACDCVRIATVPVQIMSVAPVPKPGEVLGMAASACAQTGQVLFACMSACMEPYMPRATETVTASSSCSATPRYRM